MDGPNDFRRPYGLDTKHGHLVFVFHAQNELYNTFFQASAGTLKPMFSLKNYIVAIPRKERLESELAANMSKGQLFRIIIEGSDEFTQYMKELSEDTILEN